jgi:hypothetical protein
MPSIGNRPSSSLEVSTEKPGITGEAPPVLSAKSPWSRGPRGEAATLARNSGAVPPILDAEGFGRLGNIR